MGQQMGHTAAHGPVARTFSQTQPTHGTANGQHSRTWAGSKNGWAGGTRAKQLSQLDPKPNPHTHTAAASQEGTLEKKGAGHVRVCVGWQANNWPNSAARRAHNGFAAVPLTIQMQPLNFGTQAAQPAERAHLPKAHAKDLNGSSNL